MKSYRFTNDDESGLHEDHGRWMERLAPHEPISIQVIRHFFFPRAIFSPSRSSGKFLNRGLNGGHQILNFPERRHPADAVRIRRL